MIEIIQPIKKQIVPICLAFNLVTWILGTYFSMPFILSWPLTGFLCILFFILCNFIRDKGKMASIYFIVFMFIMYIIAQGINGLASQIQGVPYYFWLTSIESWEDALSLYMVTTVIVLCAFYGSSVYYFTVIRIRLYMLIVLSLIATVIVSRVQTNIIDIHFIFFILLFLVLYVEYIHQEPYIKNHQNYKAYMQAIFLFVIVVSGVSLIVPRPSIDLENNLFDELYNRYFKTTASFNTSLLKNESEVNMISSYVSEKEVFRIKADHPLYLRIQTWDQYKNNKWTIGNNKLTNDYRLSDEYKNHLQTLSGKTIDLLSLLESMDKDKLSDELKQYTKRLEEYPFSKTHQINDVNVITKNYELQSFVSVPGIINITRQDKNDKIYYNDRLIFSLRNKQVLSPYEKYKITYLDQTLDPQERSFQFIKTLNKERYTQLLDFIYNNSKDEEVKELITDYKNESVVAYNNYTSLPKTTTKRTYKLAQTITEGLTSDYDKAKAIEEFFYEEGYIYDMEAPVVRRKKDYIDYFLFRSRRGVCVQFASAMVVLARANGLPARYVEGYRCIEYDEDKQEYVVREKHGHAFPEIYISGYGWMVFEPTRISGDGTSQQEADAGDNDGIEIAKYINNNTILFTIILFILSLILFIILKRLVLSISERLWRKKVFKITTLEAADAIFNRMLMLFHKIYLAKLTYETPETYAKRLYRNHSIDIRNEVEIFNKAHYGKISPTKEQIHEVFNKYIEIFEKTKRKGASRR